MKTNKAITITALLSACGGTEGNNTEQGAQALIQKCERWEPLNEYEFVNTAGPCLSGIDGSEPCIIKTQDGVIAQSGEDPMDLVWFHSSYTGTMRVTVLSANQQTTMGCTDVDQRYVWSGPLTAGQTVRMKNVDRCGVTRPPYSIRVEELIASWEAPDCNIMQK